MQGRTESFKVPVQRPEKLGPEHNPWYWNPSRGSVKTAPDSFKDRLEAISDSLRLTWNPITERWQLWDRCPRINHPLCVGWRLLFIHKGLDGEYLPLDERLFARLYYASSDAHGSAKEYFLRVATELERDREKREKASRQDSIDSSMEIFDYSQIKNIGKGNKFSTYHS